MIKIVGDTLYVHKGDSGVIEVQVFTDESKTTPLNITGYTVNFQAGIDFTIAFANLSIKKDNGGLGGVVITDAVNGKYQIQPAAAWTSALAIVPYVWSTKAVSPGGSVYTMGAGPLILTQNVPHS